MLGNSLKMKSSESVHVSILNKILGLNISKAAVSVL